MPIYRSANGGPLTNSQIDANTSEWHGRAIALELWKTQAGRKAICWPYFQGRAARLASRVPLRLNSGAAIYYDPTAATNGSGASHTDPTNVQPASGAYVNNTVLLPELLNVPLQFNTSSAGSYHFGTYSRMDGSRVYDPDRVATINASAFTTAVNLSGIGANATVILSGIHLTGSRNAAGTANGLFAGNDGANSTVILEWSRIDDCWSSNGTVGALASLRAQNVLVRFCDLMGADVDQLWIRAGLPNCHALVQCCTIRVGATTAVNGPDAIQFSRLAGGSFRQATVQGCWIEHNAMCKQGTFIGGNPPAAGAESIEIFHTFYFGLDDLFGRPNFAADNGGHTGIQLDVPGARIWGNYFDGWRLWANISGDTAARALYAYNFHVTDNTNYEGAATSGPMTGSGASGSDFVIYAHNTHIATKPSIAATQAVGVPVTRLSGSSNVVQNNVWLGPWRDALRLHAGSAQAENYNLFFGHSGRSVVGAASGDTLTLGANDILADPLMNYLGQPSLGSPVINAATPVTDWDGTILWKENIFGQIADDQRRQWIGAAQRVMA